MDNTVTRTRSVVAPRMKEAFSYLNESGSDIVIVSGAHLEQIGKQMGEFPCFYLGQNGNHALNAFTSAQLWRRVLSEKEKEEITNHI